MKGQKELPQAADERLLLFWQVQRREATTRPWLAGLLLRQGAAFSRRFKAFYERLSALPARRRLAIGRRFSLGLAGAALLLAMSGGRFALPAAHADPAATAAEITVDGTTCRLEDAIVAANNNSNYNGCDLSASSGADILNLTADVSYTLPEITSAITINANGHTITGSSNSVFQVRAEGNLTINEATITGGIATFGAGIDAYAESGTPPIVAVNNCTVTGNAASNSGGAIYATGTVTITQSTISGNSAATGSGGGIRAEDGTVTITQSTISDNTANGTGGGGGGLFINGAAVTLQRSIISGNNADASGDEIQYTTGSYTADAANVIGYGGSLRSTGFVKGASDVIPSGALNSVLSPLADNGGPTQTHALPAGSAALDLIAPVILTAPSAPYDQRGPGYERYVDIEGVGADGYTGDAGAYEFDPERTAVTIQSLSAVSGDPSGAAVLAGGGLLAASAALWGILKRREMNPPIP